MSKRQKNKDIKEVRSQATAQRFEIRSNGDGTRTISGTAVVYGSLSEDLGGFVEKISPGAFTKSLRDNPDVIILYNHDTGQVLGRVSSGTAEVWDTPNGLRFSCKLPNTTAGNDLAALMQRGDISQMSFGFNCVKDNWSEDANGQIIRTVQEAIVRELSCVVMPAYSATTVSVRSAPASLRAKLKKRDDDDGVCDPDSPDYDPKECDEEDRCDCTCDECQDGDCANCTDPECNDEDCEDCATQTRSAHFALILRRMRS